VDLRGGVVKFCVIGPTYPFRGGIAHYTTLLVKHLRERHQVVFYSYSRQYPRWLFPGSTMPDPSSRALKEPCERIIDPLNPLTWWQTAKRIAADKPDVLLLQWWTPFWLPLLLTVSVIARRARIPILYLCHQMTEPDSSALELLLARPALRLGDAFIVVSQKDFAMAQRILGDMPIRVGHHPIYDGFPRQGLSRVEARAQLGIEPDEPLLLFFGFVRRYKGLRYVLDALGQLSQPPRLLIAGEFWEKEALFRDLIRQLGLEQHVLIHNRYIPNEEIEPYFVAADALVLPYLSGSQSGVGMIALTYGLPVIATSIGGLAETVTHGETGLIVPPADSAALAAAIERFFREGLSERFRAAMSKARAHLSWDALIRIIEETSNDIKCRHS
jgi:glycosyltransferase involved in cell wall biosynthesis